MMGADARTRWVRARVQHWCSICGNGIAAGELYSRRYHDDYRGRARYIKKCLACLPVPAELSKRVAP